MLHLEEGSAIHSHALRGEGSASVEIAAHPSGYTEEARFKEDRHCAAIAPLPSRERGRGCPSFHSGCFAKGPSPPSPPGRRSPGPGVPVRAGYRCRRSISKAMTFAARARNERIAATPKTTAARVFKSL